MVKGLGHLFIGRQIDRLKPHKCEIAFAFLFLVLTLVMFRGYLEHTNPVGTDSMGLPFNIESNKYNHDFFQSWVTYSSLGFADNPSPVYQSTYLLLSYAGLSPLDIAKGLMIFSFWLAGVLMFSSTRWLTKNLAASLVATAVFCLNQTFLSQITEGHYYFVLGCALVPLVFVILFMLVKGQPSR
jgi:hypothetical protein